MNLSALRQLETRLGEAKGPDRVLDFWIAVEIGPNPLKSDTGTDARPGWVNDSGQEYELWGAAGRCGFIGHHVVPPVTASLDTAVSLAERILPSDADHGRRWLQILHDAVIELLGFGGSRDLLPIVVCRLAVRALIAQGEQ